MYKHGLNSFICYFILIIVATTNGIATANQSIDPQRYSERDSREFKLTKLLNIEIGGESKKQMDTDLQNAVLSEIKRGISGELGTPAEPLDHIHVPLENYNEKELGKILKQLYSKLSALQQNTSDVSGYSSSECLIQSDVEGKSYPVGVSFHRLCHPNALNKAVPQSKKNFPRSCKEIQEQGNNVSGIYQIQPKKSEKPFMVLCDMETKGGGWTHIQKRYDGSVDFFVGWREYKFGFGDLGSEFWIGLENIYKMTGFEVSELLVEIVDRDNNKAYAHFKAFGIGPESEGYILNTLRGFSGDAGDSLTPHLSSKFSTKDFDQDSNAGNCAELFKGGWWYKTCHVSNLNGKYINAVLPEHLKYQGMHWLAFKGHEYCHAKSRMMVRPVEG